MDPGTVLITVLAHPARILRGAWALEESQAAALARVLADPDGERVQVAIEGPPPGARLFPTIAELEGFWQGGRPARPGISLDLETFGPQILCAGLQPLNMLGPGGAPKAAGPPFCLRFRLSGGIRAATNWHEHCEAVRWLSALLWDPTVVKVLHNGVAFDVPILEDHGFRVRGPIVDTMLLAHLAFPTGTRVGLQALATNLLGAPSWKDLVDPKDETGEAEGDEDEPERASIIQKRAAGPKAGSFIGLDNETLGTYNAWDVAWTGQLVGPLWAAVRKVGPRQVDYYAQTVKPLQAAVLGMRRRGMLLDRDALAAYRTELHGELRQTDAETAALLTQLRPGLAPDLDSPDQMAAALFGAEGLDLKAAVLTEKKGRPSVTQDALVRCLNGFRVRDEPARPILHNLFHRSRLKTIRDRYLKLRTDEDGRVRARVRIHGARTHRFSFSEPALQQWPEECRHLFVAAPGCRFVSGDYKQLEARLLAVLANDERSLEDFAAGQDIHLMNAMDLMGWVADDLLDLDPVVQKGARNFAKGFLYGICLDGGTPVATLGPERFKPIRDIQVGDWVWSWDAGYKPTQVIRHWDRGWKACITVTVVDKRGAAKQITATPDHKFLLRNGTYCKAAHLKPGDSLMPFRRFKSKTYWQVDGANDGGRQFEHRAAVGALEGQHVHHRNRDRSDNRPENLLLANSDAEHKFHHRGEKRNLTPEQRKAWGDRARQSMDHAALAEGRRRSQAWLEAVRAKSVPAMQEARRRRLQNHKVVSVTPAGVRHVYDIEVDGEAHNFAINGAIFVHNSYGGHAETMKTKLYCPCPRCADKAPAVLKLSRDQIGAAEARWYAKHPAVPAFFDSLHRDVIRHRRYASPLGAVYQISAPASARLDRQIRNLPMQGCGAQLMNRAQVALDRIGAPIVLQHHDSFLLEVPEREAGSWGERLKGIMETPIPELGGTVFPVDLSTGQNWGALA